MKSFIAIAILSLAALATSSTTYTNKYDNVDLDEILSNKRLLYPYLKCVLGQGRCSPDGTELKTHIKEALENNCGKCTEAQRKGTRKVISHLINKEPNWWNQLVAKYDPNHQYTRKYEKELRAAHH